MIEFKPLAGSRESLNDALDFSDLDFATHETSYTDLIDDLPQVDVRLNDEEIIDIDGESLSNPRPFADPYCLGPDLPRTAFHLSETPNATRSPNADLSDASLSLYDTDPICDNRLRSEATPSAMVSLDTVEASPVLVDLMAGNAPLAASVQVGQTAKTATKRRSSRPRPRIPAGERWRQRRLPPALLKRRR